MNGRRLPGIVQAGHPVLRGAAKPVPAEMFGTAELASLIESMVAVMRAAPGVGLAAPQIGVALRVAVIEDSPELAARLSEQERAERERVAVPLTVLINPEMTVVDGTSSATFFEGCLSVTGYAALVERRREVAVRAFDAAGKPFTWSPTGWPARIVQHELDHLDGALYIDRMLARSFCSNHEMLSRWAGRSIAEIRAALDA